MAGRTSGMLVMFYFSMQVLVHWMCIFCKFLLSCVFIICTFFFASLYASLKFALMVKSVFQGNTHVKHKLEYNFQLNL